MNLPNPALVTQRAAQRLPRVALLLFCAAYLLPGLFGRDPWRNADLTAFGFMSSIASGASGWWSPTIAGIASSGAVLPYWFGAAFIKLLPFADPALAARIPFAILLGLTFAFTWYTTYHLARTNAAKPLPFAFGGEASDVDYARAVADGALLALIATLGLLQLGHETTPELVQLGAVAVFLYGLSAYRDTPTRAAVAVVVALPMLAASGAPTMAVGLSLLAAVAVWPWSSRKPSIADSGFAATTPADPRVDIRLAAWALGAGALAVVVASALGVWAWRLTGPTSSSQWLGVLRLLVWFNWPTWPLAIYTLWRWRRQLRSAHIAVPATIALVALVSCIAMGGSDRALMLATPALAVLAAFALPTLKRSAAAAIDWFSVCFFTIFAGAIWVIYVAMQTGVPAKPAANVAKLALGFTPSFSLIALLFALLGTGAWLWLVRWRAGRNRHPLWKSMVLPASGVALCWLLLMTLGLPPLDYARSYRPMIRNIARHAPEGSCTYTINLPLAQLAGLEYFGRYEVRPVGLDVLADASKAPTTEAPCDYLMLQDSEATRAVVPQGWTTLGRERRPTEVSDITVIYRRSRAGG